jgi:N,N'-diacetyllegionaminate synthase
MKEGLHSFSKYIEVEGRRIGLTFSVFIVAEIGVNHNGDMELAKQTIQAAAVAGADCVKFQSFRAEEFMSDHDLVYEYENGTRRVKESMYTMFKRLEFPLEFHNEIFEFARSCDLIPLTSVADTECMKTALNAGAGALKLASEDFINYPLLKAAASADVPLILSTGMADESEIYDTVRILRECGCKDVVILHCVSLYPTPTEMANLLRIREIARVTNTCIGYSDHTIGVEACLLAVSLGACVIEKHFTLDRSLPGPDHSFSADPKELSHIVKGVRRIEKMLGNGHITPTKGEEKSRLTFRRSIVAAKDLAAGTILCTDNLDLKRPGNGIHPRHLPELCGRRLNAPISKDQQIKHEILGDRLNLVKYDQ